MSQADGRPADADVVELLGAMCEGELQPADAARLERLICSDSRVRGLYLRYIDLHVELSRRYGTRFTESASEVGPDNVAAIHPVAQTESGDDSPRRVPRDLEDPLPPLVFDLAGSGAHGGIGYFPQGVLFSYFVAAVLVGLGVLVGALIPVNHPGQMADNRPATSPGVAQTALEMIGRITGMVDCRWADPHTAVPGPVAVPLGRKYALSSGLMEITYDTGAKVILQGPCTYEVESPVGGYLSLGKLTAKVEKRVATTSNPQFPIPNPLFSIRTPTATVTDLGTEFGVEVDQEGATISHVFQGDVEMQSVSHDGKAGEVIHLRKNESARAERGRGPEQGQATLHRATANPRIFVRQLAKSRSVVDLLDVVAGGNGSENHRERGIEPTTGKQASSYVYPIENQGAIGQYRPVTWNPLVDGVFVPNGSSGPVQLDSVGHTFDGFRSEGYPCSTIWAYVAVKDGGSKSNDNVMQFVPHTRGLLEMHPCKGITFSLDGVRNAYDGMIPTRFRAIAGVAHPDGLVDFWVFVDGQVRFRRFQMCNANGPLPINVEIKPGERFLTLASTYGRSDPTGSWLVLGDPRLELTESKLP